MRSTRAIRTRKVRGTIYKVNLATDKSAQRLDLRGVRFIYRSLWRPLLRGGVVGLHPSERLFHFAEDPNRVGNQIRGNHRVRAARSALAVAQYVGAGREYSSCRSRPAFGPLRHRSQTILEAVDQDAVFCRRRERCAMKPIVLDRHVVR